MVEVCGDLQRKLGVTITRKNIADMMLEVKPELRLCFEEMMGKHGPFAIEEFCDGMNTVTGDLHFYIVGAHLLFLDGTSIHGPGGLRRLDNCTVGSRDYTVLTMQEVVWWAFPSGVDLGTLVAWLAARVGDNCSAEVRAGEATEQLVTSLFGAEVREFDEDGDLQKEKPGTPFRVGDEWQALMPGYALTAPFAGKVAGQQDTVMSIRKVRPNASDQLGISEVTGKWQPPPPRHGAWLDARPARFQLGKTHTTTQFPGKRGMRSSIWNLRGFRGHRRRHSRW
jgi:hypothetical protein